MNSEDIPYFVLGGGSNVLFSDEGFEGVVIKLQTSELKLREDNEIVVAAGVLLNKVVNFALQNKLSGMEWGTGIREQLVEQYEVMLVLRKRKC